MEDKEFTLEQLKFIYEKQHYFIDRHETMAEKYFTVLSILGGIATLLMTVNSDKVLIMKNITLLSYILFILAFSISLLKLIKTVNPLSTFFMKHHRSIKDNKNWVNESYIYYRGIVSRFEHQDVKEFVSDLKYEQYSLDLAKQISVLAHYSDYKRSSLEKAKLWVYLAIFFAVLNLLLLMISLYL
jgi:hypothetical protein